MEHSIHFVWPVLHNERDQFRYKSPGLFQGTVSEYPLFLVSIYMTILVLHPCNHQLQAIFQIAYETQIDRRLNISSLSNSARELRADGRGDEVLLVGVAFL
jgi:hypothetical protein